MDRLDEVKVGPAQRFCAEVLHLNVINMHHMPDAHAEPGVVYFHDSRVCTPSSGQSEVFCLSSNAHSELGLISFLLCSFLVLAAVLSELLHGLHSRLKDLMPNATITLILGIVLGLLIEYLYSGDTVYTQQKPQFAPDSGSKLCIHIHRSRYVGMPPITKYPPACSDLMKASAAIALPPRSVKPNPQTDSTGFPSWWRYRGCRARPGVVTAAADFAFIFNTKFLVFNTQFLVFTTNFLVFDTWYGLAAMSASCSGEPRS